MSSVAAAAPMKMLRVLAAPSALTAPDGVKPTSNEAANTAARVLFTLVICLCPSTLYQRHCYTRCCLEAIFFVHASQRRDEGHAACMPLWPAWRPWRRLYAYPGSRG